MRKMIAAGLTAVLALGVVSSAPTTTASAAPLVPTVSMVRPSVVSEAHCPKTLGGYKLLTDGYLHASDNNDLIRNVKGCIYGNSKTKIMALGTKAKLKLAGTYKAVERRYSTNGGRTKTPPVKGSFSGYSTKSKALKLFKIKLGSDKDISWTFSVKFKIGSSKRVYEWIGYADATGQA